MATDVGSDELSDTAGGEHNQLERLGKYRIEKRIGAGGMGTVFLAVDTDLNRTVALKVLPKDRAANPVLVRRFKAEGQAAAQMEHPNIVRVFEAGEVDGFLYMALEYVEGIDVYELVARRGVIPVKRSTDIIRQTALALQHAYQRGIVHRDIKPSNLLIKRDGSVKLADMGLARSVDETLETDITRAGTTVGTVDYMSPEQARNSKSADVRSDIYSLGCTWFHMLTGHPPFHEGGMTNKLQAHAVSTRPDPRSENDRIPEGIVAIIQRMMACKPADRYQTPQELLDDLEAAGRMHRTVDESTLAALADEGMTEAIIEDEAESVLRVGDIDEFNLAALKESGEHESPSHPPAPRRPLAPQERERSAGADRKARAAHRTASGADATTQEAPPLPDSRPAFAPVESDGPGPQTAARRTPPPAEEPRPADNRRDASPQKPTTSPSGRASRRASRSTGGHVSELPTPGTASPVDGAGTARGIDLEILKFVIPAVLVVAALVGLVFAVMRAGDSLGITPATNPYATERQDEEVRPARVPPLDNASEQPRAESLPPVGEQPPQIVELPFPGAEGSSQPSDGRLPLVPDWVNAFRRPAVQSGRSLVVRRRPEGSGQVATINEALDAIPDAGGVIEIDGDGPFRLEAVTIRNRQRVRIQAAEGRRPVIHLIPADDWKSGPLISVTNSQIELQGLHFVLVDADPTDAVLIGIDRADAAFRDCSVTVETKSPRPMTALRILSRGSERGEAPVGKCLLENVIIRGGNLTSVVLEGPASDLVAGNCLLVSGDAPAIVFDSAASRDADPLHRGLRLLATTVASSQSAIVVRHEESDRTPVPIDVLVRRSILLRPSGAARSSAAMAMLSGWPPGDGGLGNSRIHRLTFQAEESLFVGWPQLLTLTNSAGEPVDRIAADTDAWRKYWNQGMRSDAVLTESVSLSYPSAVTPDAIHAQLSALAPASGQLPGCRPAEFPEQPTGLIEHVVAATRRPYEPEHLGSGMAITGEPVRFDLGLRRSLARFLASDACPDGTHVVAFGSSLKELEPLLIENKSIRLEFQSTDKPLVVQPIVGRDGVPAGEALITVRNGTLDLVAAPLKLPALNRNYPRSIILLENGSVAVRHCRLEGPRVESGDVGPLVRLAEPAADAKQNVLLDASFLVSRGPLVAGPTRWGTLIARNCVLVSRGDAIVVHSASDDDQQPVQLVLDHCSIASGGAAVRADFNSSAASATPALTLHARGCIFAGPPAGSSAASVVVAHSAGAAQNGSLVWWGSLNGYSERLAGSVVDESGRPGDFSHDWASHWGEGHEAQSLTGRTDVLFQKPLPDLQLVEPESLQLSDSATAATWGADRGRIGASVGDIGPQSHRRDAPPSAKPGGGQKAGSRSDPGF